MNPNNVNSSPTPSRFKIEKRRQISDRTLYNYLVTHRDCIGRALVVGYHHRQFTVQMLGQPGVMTNSETGGIFFTRREAITKAKNLVILTK